MAILKKKQESRSSFYFLPAPHPDQSNPFSWMALRSAMLGVRCVLGSSAPVSGLVLFPSANQLVISRRSYVWPSTVMTGSLIISIVNGHWKEFRSSSIRTSAGSACVPRLNSSSSGMSSTSSGRFLRRASRHLSAMSYSLPMRSCLCWSQHGPESHYHSKSGIGIS